MPTFYTRRVYGVLATYAAVFLSILLAACAADHTLPATKADSAPLAAIPAGLPTPAALAGRQASNSLGYVLGSHVGLNSHNLFNSSNVTLRLEPSSLTGGSFSTCAYAGFNIPVDDPGLLRIRPKWAVEPGAGRAFIGLGNRATQRWDWRALSDPSADIEASNFADYLGADNSLLLMLLLTPGPPAQLDLLTVQTRPGSGWQFVELFPSEESNTQYSIAGRPFIWDGKPAFDYNTQAYIDSTIVDPHHYLAYSSSGSGDSVDDWQRLELDFSPVSFCQVGSGVGALHTEYDEINDLVSLYYDYASAPGETFSKELVLSDKVIFAPKLSAVAGLPAIVYSQSDVDSNIEVKVYFASSTAAQGGTWSSALVSTDSVVSTALSSLYTPALDYNAKPLIGYYDLNPNPAQFTVASGKVGQPTGPADWDVVALGPGYDTGIWAYLRNGKPGFASQNYIVFPPDEVQFWTYELTGTDPALSGDWTATSFDNLGFGTDRIVSMISIGNELFFSRLARVSGSPFLDGSLGQFELWHSAAPSNVRDDWSIDLVSRNDDMFGPVLIDLNGQPAALQSMRASAGFSGDERTIMRMVWGVYEP